LCRQDKVESPCFLGFSAQLPLLLLIPHLAPFSKHKQLLDTYNNHLFILKQDLYLFYLAVIRKGTFARYDYGLWGNLKRYGQLRPPPFDLSNIPESLRMWMGYGGLDALADVTDVERTIKELRTTPELLYIGDYGHIDFVMSIKAKDDVYVDLMRFLKANASLHSSY
jgi:lysosomal acid lipase/cholesteryl ester hydrolase